MTTLAVIIGAVALGGGVGMIRLAHRPPKGATIFRVATIATTGALVFLGGAMYLAGAIAQGAFR